MPQPAVSWFFGEGATGAFFDTYLLSPIRRRSPPPSTSTTCATSAARSAATYTVPANARFSVWVEGEPGLAATSFGTRVTSDVPIVAERAMYWAGGFFDYYEGHVSAGATRPDRAGCCAESEEGGAYQRADLRADRQHRLGAGVGRGAHPARALPAGASRVGVLQVAGTPG